MTAESPPDASRTWIELRSGAAFDLLDPTADQVVLDDLIYAVCRIARFIGHTNANPWTVGAHSLLVADLLRRWGAPPEIVREGLLHDIAEGIYGDIPSPVAIALDVLVDDNGLAMNPLRELRRRVDRVVRAQLSLPETESPLVKRADLVALAIEVRDLRASACARHRVLPEYAPVDINIKADEFGWSSADVEKAFRRRLAELESTAGAS